jgi:hypothetical protein
MRAPMPRFTYVPATSAVYVKPVILDIAFLLLFTFVFFFLSFAAFLRYDVR